MRCHNTQIIPDQIHNRSMFRRFFPVVHQGLYGIGQGSVYRTFHGIRADNPFLYPNKNLRRENYKTILYPYFI